MHLASGPGSILGAPAASSCPGCESSFPQDLASERTQVAWDRDIPAINQGLIPEETPASSFLLEGDIIRPSPFRLLSAASGRWPKSGGFVEVPVLLSSKYNELSRRVILAAFAEFERLTCVRCFSSVGRSGGLQVLSLAPACLRRGPGIALHELMHVLGFWHEHTRADRDRYVRVDWREILPGFEINFIKSRSSNMLAPYDYSSVMHYGRLAFSRRGAPTIVPLWDPRAHLGQRWNLSASDVTRVLRLYACSPHAVESQRPTAASGLPLQRLLKAMLPEPRTPHPAGFRPGGQRVTAGTGESPPRLKESQQEATARPLAPRSRLGAPAPGTALARSRLAGAPTVPPALEAGVQPAPI